MNMNDIDRAHEIGQLKDKIKKQNEVIIKLARLNSGLAIMSVIIMILLIILPLYLVVI
jgi:hypothetical protein